MQAENNTGVRPMTRDVCISRFPAMFQPSLIPELEDSSIDSGRYELFLATLEMLDLESLDINRRSDTGRPPKDRVAIARAFVAKATWGMKTTRELLDRLKFESLCVGCAAGCSNVRFRARRRSAAPLPSLPPPRCRRECTRSWSGKSITAVWLVMLPVMRRR